MVIIIFWAPSSQQLFVVRRTWLTLNTVRYVPQGNLVYVWAVNARLCHTVLRSTPSIPFHCTETNYLPRATKAMSIQSLIILSVMCLALALPEPRGADKLSNAVCHVALPAYVGVLSFHRHYPHQQRVHTSTLWCPETWCVTSVNDCRADGPMRTRFTILPKPPP